MKSKLPSTSGEATLAEKHNPEGSGGRPDQLAGGWIECAYARFFRPDIEKQFAVVNQRSAAGAEPALGRLVPLVNIHAPQHRAGSQVKRVQHTLGPKREHLPIGHRGRGARAVVKAKIVPVVGGIVERPNRLAGGCFKRFDDLALALAVKKDHLACGDHGRGKSGAHFRLPGKLCRPGDIGIGIDSVSTRAEQLRPVVKEEQKRQCKPD